MVTDDPNETAIRIAGRRFRFWTDVEITRAIDALSTVTFSAPFEPDAPAPARRSARSRISRSLLPWAAPRYFPARWLT